MTEAINGIEKPQEREAFIRLGEDYIPLNVENGKDESVPYEPEFDDLENEKPDELSENEEEYSSAIFSPHFRFDFDDILDFYEVCSFQQFSLKLPLESFV